MSEEHIVVVDDNRELCNIIADEMEDRYEEYVIDRFYDATDAKEFISAEIDEKGDRLALVASDERLRGLQGHEFLSDLTDTHPRSKKIIFSAYSDVEAIKAGVNRHFDAFVNKETASDAGDYLFDKVRELLEAHERQPCLEYTIGDITFKMADTLYEKQEFLRRRYEIYLKAGHKDSKHMREEENEREMEWDRFDIGGSDQMILSPHTRYILALDKARCVGGVRIIDGSCPMEDGYCVEEGYGFSEGDPFTLDFLKSEGVYTREISRLIVEEEYRTNSVVLMGLFRMVSQLTSEQNWLLCTSKEEQKKLYQAIGFEQIGPKIEYSLKGQWIPMMRDMFKAIHEPEKVENISPRFHKRCIEPVPASDQEKWNEYSRIINEEAINRGFYLNERE